MKSNLLKSLLIYFIGYMVVGSITINMIPDKYYIYGQLILTLLTLLLIIKCSKNYFEKNFLKDIQECLDKSIRLGIYTFLIIMVSITLTSLSRNLGFSDTTQNNNIITSLAKESPISVGIIIIGLLPFIEELIFKYQLFDNTNILKNHRMIKTLVIGILFASLHCLIEIINLDIMVIISFINYLVFYITTNFIYKKYKNLMMSIAIHCLYNAISFILIF